MSHTSIRLVFSSQHIDPERISDVLGMKPSSRNVSSGEQSSPIMGFPFWELPDEELHSVEILLSQWISLLEKVNSQLNSLSDSDLGGYLDVRVYEDNFYLKDDLLSRLGVIGIGVSVWFNPPEQLLWTEPEHESALTFPVPQFYCCQLDEDHFFGWLKQIEGVKDVHGHSAGLTVYLSVRHLSDSSLRDLIGLLYRYNVSMSVLRTQLTSKNETWFKNPEAFWYQKIFDDSDFNT